MIGPVIVELFTPIVERVSAKLTAKLAEADSNITGVWYKYGHPKEIIELLSAQANSDATKAKRYPLIAIFQDFPETKGKKGIYSEVSLSGIIATRTNENYRAAERYQYSFKPILYPIYEEFMRQIALPGSPFFTFPDIPHIKIDRLYWGNKGLEQLNDGKTKNVFNDRLDVIEFRDLKLSVKPNNQC